MGLSLSFLVFTVPFSASTCVKVVSRCCPSRINNPAVGGISLSNGTFSNGLTCKRASPPVSSSITAHSGKERAYSLIGRVHDHRPTPSRVGRQVAVYFI